MKLYMQICIEQQLLIRVDHGKEFFLSLYIQEKLLTGRGDVIIHPYVQTTSTATI